MTTKRTWPIVVGLAVIGSQAGHLLAYQLRFGAAAQHVQSSGAHGYFPVLAKTSLGAVGAALVAGLFIIGLARVLTGRASIRTSAGPSYVGLLAVLFTVQLACFVGQEVGEALLAGSPVDSAPHLVLWGTLGQLPVAALAAVALAWLARRYESAVNEVRAVLNAPSRPALLAIAIPVWVTPGGALLLSQVAGASLAKRGPPSSSRFSSY